MAELSDLIRDIEKNKDIIENILKNKDYLNNLLQYDDDIWNVYDIMNRLQVSKATALKYMRLIGVAKLVTTDGKKSANGQLLVKKSEAIKFFIQNKD